MSSNADVAIAGAATATVSITFAASGATFFQAGDCAAQTILNIPALARSLSRHREWKARYVVITEVVSSSATVVLVSSELGAKAELHVSPEELPGSSLFASAGAGLQHSARKGFAAHLASESGATPLFQAMQLRKRPARGNMRYRHESHMTDPGAPASDLILRRLAWNQFAADT